jgi:hypothetical protein
MLDRSTFLLVHGVTAEEWARRYDIEPFTHPCSDCGAELTTSIPFAKGELRGLVAPKCTCGNEGTPYCVVRDPKSGGDILSEGFDLGSGRPTPPKGRNRRRRRPTRRA